MSSNDNGGASDDPDTTPPGVSLSHALINQVNSENNEYPGLPPDSPLTEFEESDDEEAAAEEVRQMGPLTELEAATEQLRQRIEQVEGPTARIRDWDDFLTPTIKDYLDDSPSDWKYTVKYADPSVGPGQARSETLQRMRPVPKPSPRGVHDPKKHEPWFPPHGVESELAQAHLRHMLAYKKKRTPERLPSSSHTEEYVADATSPITRPTPRLWQDQEAQKSSRRHKTMAQQLPYDIRSYYGAFTRESQKGGKKRAASDGNAGPSSGHARKRRRVAFSDAVDTESQNKAHLDVVMKFLTSDRVTSDRDQDMDMHDGADGEYEHAEDITLPGPPLSPLRRICRHEDTVTDGLAKPQGNPAELRQKVANLAERFWENVEGQPMPKTYRASNIELADRGTVQTAEELYIVDWEGADPLEPLFDEPSRPFGLFDDTEFEYWRHQQAKKNVEGPKKRGRKSAAEKAAIAERQQEYEDEFQMSADELEEDFRTLEKTLVAQKKMLPPGVKPYEYWEDEPARKKGKAVPTVTDPLTTLARMVIAPQPKTTSAAAVEKEEPSPRSSVPTNVPEASCNPLLAQWVTEGMIGEHPSSMPEASRIVVLKVNLRPLYSKWLLDGRTGGLVSSMK